MKKKLFTILTIAFIFTSCTKIMYKNGSIGSLSVDPIPAEIIVDKSKTLQGTSITKVTFGIFKSGDSNYIDITLGGSVASKAKQAAMYKALVGTKYDILVNPKYIININKSLFQKTTTATVIGYGAKVKIKD